MDKYKYKIEWCNNCRQGWIEIWKDSETNKLFLSCSECECIWKNPQELKKSNSAIGFAFERMYVEPTEDEIIEIGWDKFIIDN